MCTSNCNAINCIYILICEICDSYYIGQSKKFKERFRNHISTIKNFEFHKLDKNAEVAEHFNLPDHKNKYEDKLKWLIFKNEISNLNLRVSYEQEIIKLFEICGNKLLNEDKNANLIKTFFTI